MRLRNAVFLSALLIGLATMTGITAIRGVLESQRVEREIAADLETESFVHLGAISEALWIFDHTLLQAVLDGIIAGPNISYAAVVDKDAVVAAAGAERAGAEYTRRTPVLYQDRGTSRTIGTLIVQGDLGVLRDRSRAWILKDLPPIAAGILLCALLIALSFEILVTRRLERDARAFVSPTTSPARPLLSLHRGLRPGTRSMCWRRDSWSSSAPCGRDWTRRTPSSANYTTGRTTACSRSWACSPSAKKP